METYSHLQYLEEQLEELDWFSKLPSQLVHKTRDSITLAVKQKKIFWTPPIDVEFDYEWGIDDKMHSKLLETFSSASYGVLNPHRITEALELSTNFGSVHFSFSCNEKTYSISMPHNGDWICLDFFNLLDAVMYDTGTSLQFIDLNNPTKELQNQLAQFILCTPQAFFKAAERGLISPVRHITWLDGDILSYRLKSGDFILILVINLEEKEGLFGAVCAILDWHGPRVPRVAEFTKLKIHKNDNDEVTLFFLTQLISSKLPLDRLELIVENYWDFNELSQIMSRKSSPLIFSEWHQFGDNIKRHCNWE